MTNSLPETLSVGILNVAPFEQCCALPGKCREQRSCLMIVNAVKGAIAVRPQLLSFGRDLGSLPRSHLLNDRRFNIPIAFSQAYSPQSIAGESLASAISFRNLSAFLSRSKHSSQAGSLNSLPF